MSINGVGAVVNIIPVNQTEDTTSGNEHDLCTAIIQGGSSMDLNISIFDENKDASTDSSRPFLALLTFFLLNIAWTTGLITTICCQHVSIW